MNLLDAIILGVVQGVTEFLPVSSTAHTNLIEQFCSIKAMGKDFCVLLNIGTIFSILCYYYKDTVKMILGVLDFLCMKSSTNRDFFWLLLASNIPAIIVLGSLECLNLNVDSVTITAINLIIFGIVLYFCDKKPEIKKEMSLIDGLKIGTAQILSFFPGVSRLGICLSMSRFLGYNRRDSFKFSMILSIIPIMGACFVKLIKMIIDLSINVSESLIGISVAFMCGMCTLYIIDKFLKKHSLMIFVVYRILLGIAILV